MFLRFFLSTFAFLALFLLADARIDRFRSLTDDFTGTSDSTVPPVRVSCIGDSITYGVCGPLEGGGYVTMLQSILGSDYTVSNFGVSSMTMLKNGLCFPTVNLSCSYWDTPQWGQALQSKPDIVTIMLGTNDAKTFNWNSSGIYYAIKYVVFRIVYFEVVVIWI